MQLIQKTLYHMSSNRDDQECSYIGSDKLNKARIKQTKTKQLELKNNNENPKLLYIYIHPRNLTNVRKTRKTHTVPRDPI